MNEVHKGSGQQTEVGGCRVHFYDHGTGDALVMLHGGGPGATGWFNFGSNIAPLAEHFRVIVADLPGFGESGPVASELGYPTFAATVVAGLLDQLGVERAHFVGNSLGGGTALRFALMHPGRAGKLLLLNPAGGPASLFTPAPTAEMKMLLTYYDSPGPSYEKMAAFCEEMVFDPACATPEFVAERYEESIAPGRDEGQRTAIKSLRAQDPEGGPGHLWLESSNLRHETLLLWGREDRAAPLDTGLMWLKRIPSATLLVVPQCGHWIQMEHPSTFKNIALSFLADERH